MIQVRHVAREITTSLLTIFIGLKIIFCLVRVFFSIDMLRSGTNPVIALQPINSMGELGYFHHLQQRTLEQKLTRKGTVELCDGSKGAQRLRHSRKTNDYRKRSFPGTRRFT